MSASSSNEGNSALSIPLSEIGWSAAAAAFNLCYAGYVIPVNMRAEDIRLRVLAENIDPDRSYVVYECESPVAMAFVARRGATSRLAAFGVSPTRRRNGVGRHLLARVIDEALKQGDASMELEVIDSNSAAASLYQAFGFRSVDTLLGFETEVAPVPGSALLRQEGVEQIATAIAEDTPNALPWQLAAESLTQLSSGWTVVSIDGGARAIINFSREDAVVLRLVHTPQPFRSRGSARRLIEAIFTEAAGRPIRVPQLIPARYERFARRMGFTTSALRQRRMLLDFRAEDVPASSASPTRSWPT